jgi:hypothetical protein
MSTTADALRILQSYVKRHRDANITFNSLLSYAEKFLIRAVEENPDLEDFADNPANLMTAYLIELAKDGRVRLRYSGGTIMGVLYPEYYHALVRKAYERLDAQPDRPFPSEEALNASIPEEFITPVDVKTEFVSWLGGSERSEHVLLRLMFPEGVHSMVASTELLPKELARIAVQKIRQYLRSEKNAGYMRSKLGSIFRQRENAMTDVLNSIQTTPDKALRTIAEPTDFTFHFWTQLSSTLIKEYSTKKEKLIEEHGYCQAAYLIGYYCVHHRGVLQRRRDTENALRDLDSSLRKAPYAFTISQIYSFTDTRGVPLTKRYRTEDVNSFIGQRLKAPDEQGLPQILRVKTTDGTEYYIYKDYAADVVLDAVFEARRSYREYYLREWTEALKANRRHEMLTDDAAFEKDVQQRLRSSDPLLHALLNFNLLYLLAQEPGLSGETRRELREFFDTKNPRLRPVPEILNLDRKKLLTDARLVLPFWQAVPVLSAIVRFFKRVFIGLSEEEREVRRSKTRSTRPQPAAQATTTMRYDPEAVADVDAAPGAGGGGVTASGVSSLPSGSDAAGRRAQLTRFKDAVRQLQAHYVGEGGDVDRTLKQLIDRWNPLLDGGAKENLVEDVNSLCRDFLRRMKVTFRLVPPTQARVKEWAGRIVQNEVFEQIRRKDALREYLELYMLKVLGK